MIFEQIDDGTDFRIEIERKFLQSKINQGYVFPRKTILDISSSDSDKSVRFLGVYDLNQQHKKIRNHSQENKPKLLMEECKSKRLKTEGNEKLDTQLEFKFESESEEGEPGYYNKPEYKSLLIDLQKKLCKANFKVSSKAEVLPVSSKIPQNQLYSQKSRSKQSLQRTSSDHYRGSSSSIDKNKHIKTTMDNYDKYEKATKNSKPKICSSKQNTINTEVTPLMTKGSSAKKKPTKINIPQKVKEISKVYLQPNINSQCVKIRSKGKQESIKTKESDQSLTQEYLLQILSKQSKPAQINTQVQNPVFNLRNSNINVSLNFNTGLKKPQIIQQTMLVAELLKCQQNKKKLVKPSQRCQSSQQYRCSTEPEEQDQRRPSNKSGLFMKQQKSLKNKFKGLFIDVDPFAL